MKKTLIILMLIVSGVAFVASPVFAENTPPTQTPPTQTPPTQTPPTQTPPGQTTGGTAACDYNTNSTVICNPISGTTDAKQLLIKIIKYLLSIIALVAVAVIVISGFRLVISQGNESQVKAARSAITYAIVGLFVAALAYSIIAIIDGALNFTATR